MISIQILGATRACSQPIENSHGLDIVATSDTSERCFGSRFRAPEYDQLLSLHSSVVYRYRLGFWNVAYSRERAPMPLRIAPSDGTDASSATFPWGERILQRLKTPSAASLDFELRKRVDQETGVDPSCISIYFQQN